MWPFRNNTAVTATPTSPDPGGTSDGTDMAQLEAELIDLRTRLDLVRQATSDGLWDMEVPATDVANERNTLWLSDQFRRLLGFRDEKELPNVLGSWSLRLHPEDRVPTLSALAAHLNDRSGRTPYDVTHRLRCRDGQFRWFRTRGQTLRDAQGLPLRLAGSLTCIDEQLQRERELEKTLVRLELSTELINDGLWDIGIEGGDPFHAANTVWWSPQMRAQLGFKTEQEFPNEMGSWANRLHPEDKERAINAFVAHLADRSGATPYDVEYRLQCKDEQYRWFRARGQTRRSADGTPLRAVGSLLDIHTAREVRASQAQRDAYQRQLEAGLKDIAGIVGTIQQIAQQTNLIALNAAVEAARAGPSGRGFSVIANEIRALSARTTAATDDVSRIHQKLAMQTQENRTQPGGQLAP